MDKVQKFCIVTGASGGIGQALVQAFEQSGYAVIATDIKKPPANIKYEFFIKADLERTVTDEVYANQIFDRLRKAIEGNPLTVLINNAATQILGQVEKLSRENWNKTLNINLLAPFFWSQALLPELKESKGCIINISSIHANLTKREFSAYATSKAALSALTKSLAIELGNSVRVNAIEAAAVDTDMLRAGFVDDMNSFETLKNFHPTQEIGRVDEVGKLAVMLANEEIPFLNGATIQLDGGISNCLHDPA